MPFVYKKVFSFLVHILFSLQVIFVHCTIYVVAFFTSITSLLGAFKSRLITHNLKHLVEANKV